MPRRLIVAVCLAWLGLPAAALHAEPQIVSSLAADEFVTVEDLVYERGVTTATVVNRSDGPLENVRLRLSFSWRWKDELHPGSDDPSFAVPYEIADIPARGKTTLRHESPTPTRTDGSFHVEASIVGLTRVQTR